MNKMTIFGHLPRHHGHMGSMLDADWLKKFLLRSDWLGPSIAYLTTGVCRQVFKIFVFVFQTFIILIKKKNI